MSMLATEKLKQKVQESKRSGRLNLSFLGLTDVPPNLVTLVKTVAATIVECDLRGNALTTLGSTLTEIRTVRTLKLSDNRFTELPRALTAMPRLQVLNLSGNKLSALDESVGMLAHLRELDVSGNQITYIDAALGRLEHLQVLNLEGNSLSFLPDNVIAPLRSLEKLDLRSNVLESLPAAVLGALPRLHELHLRGNRLPDLYMDKAEHGTPLLLEFLREEGVRLAAEAAEKLRPVGVANGPFTEYDLFSVEGASENSIPRVRAGYAIVQSGPTTYIFGGHIVGGTVSDELWELHQRRLAWQLITSPNAADHPCARTGATLAASEDGESLYLFGGTDSAGKYLNDLYIFDVNSSQWSKAATEGAVPSPRDNASIVVWQGSLIVFGGMTPETEPSASAAPAEPDSVVHRNDVHVLDLSSLTWHAPVVSGVCPSPCANICNARAPAPAPHWWMYGISDVDNALADMRCLDLQSMRWRALPILSCNYSYQGDCAALYYFQGALWYFAFDSSSGGSGACNVYRMTMAEGDGEREDGEEFAGMMMRRLRHGSRIGQHAVRKNAMPDNMWFQLHGATDKTSAFQMPCAITFWDDKIITIMGSRAAGGDEDNEDDEEGGDGGEGEGEGEQGRHAEDAAAAAGAHANAGLADAEAALHDKKPTAAAAARDDLSLADDDDDGELSSRSTSSSKPSRHFSIVRVASLSDLAADASDPSPVVALTFDGKYSKAFQAHVEKALELTKPAAAELCNGLIDTPELVARKALMQHVKQFMRHFAELYPWRRSLTLTPFDENGVPRLLCTTLRPTLLPYPELFDASACAAFIADYLYVQPVAKPAQFPTVILSPATTARLQVGTCFEASMLLCSLLLGAGYDSYVAIGYAPKWITTADQSHLTCPVSPNLSTPAANAPPESGGEAAGTAAGAGAAPSGAAAEGEPESGAAESRNDTAAGGGGGGGGAAAEEEDFYALPTCPRFPMLERLQSRADPEDTTTSEPEQLPDSSEGDAEIPADSMKPNTRVHCWVLVKSGSREVSHDFLLEAATGVRYSIHDAPYYGVEMVFNTKNLWVNVQDPAQNPVECNGPGLRDLALDLGDEERWERLVADDASVDQGIVSEEAMDDRASVTSAVRVQQPSHVAASSDIIGVSWVPPLSISQAAFDRRSPEGHRHVLYERALLETYAKYGNKARWDGRLQRLTNYHDSARTEAVDCMEWFARRKDQLTERYSGLPSSSSSPLAKKPVLIEHFSRGAAFALRTLRATGDAAAATAAAVAGADQGDAASADELECTFFSSARVDGLELRQYVPGRSMVEEFSGREDRVVKRRVEYMGAPAGAGARTRIGRIIVDYERNSEVAAEEDVARVTYDLARRTISLDFHYGLGRVTAPSRVYSTEKNTGHHDHGAGGFGQYINSAPALLAATELPGIEKRPSPEALVAEGQKWRREETQCIEIVCESENEIFEIMVTRAHSDTRVELLVPYYDIHRIHRSTTFASNGDAGVRKVQSATDVTEDYLAPFLPKDSNRDLSKEEAIQVRDRCLRALKERLVERASIIQTRQDEETALLAKRQVAFQRGREQMTRAEEEEFERQSEQIMFRIHILEQRIRRHGEQAMQKYYDLEEKLNADMRLKLALEAD